MLTLRESFRKSLEKAFPERGDQADFVRRSGISALTVIHWLKGRRVPDLDQIEAVSKALGKSAREMLFPEKDDLSPAWREIFREIGDIDKSEMPAVLTGIRAVLAALRKQPARLRNRND